MTATFRDQGLYRRIFLEANGRGPWSCYFGCGEPVVGAHGRLNRMTFVVHHIDHDPTNNAPENLVPAHNGCHVAYHNTGTVRSAEARAKTSATLTGRTRGPLTQEHRDKLSAAGKGRAVSLETREKIAAALKGKSVGGKGQLWLPERREAVSARMKGNAFGSGPKSPEACANMSAAAKGNTNAKGKPKSPEARSNLSATLRARPHASCVKCHREFVIGTGLALHLRACRSKP